MRIALQISGELRTLSYCYENLKKYIYDLSGSNTIDIFLHTWYCESGSEPSGHGEGIALLKPRSFTVEKYENCEFLHNLPRSMTMFYSIWQTNHLRKDYEKIMEQSYDIVIRYRTDCLFGEQVLPLIQSYLEEKTSVLVIPKSKRIFSADGPSDSEAMMCDWFAFGTPDTMDAYCDIYNTWFKQGIYPVPESMIYLQCKIYGITEKTCLRRPLFDYFLIESNGKIRGLEEFVGV